MAEEIYILENGKKIVGVPSIRVDEKKTNRRSLRGFESDFFVNVCGFVDNGLKRDGEKNILEHILIFTIAFGETEDTGDIFAYVHSEFAGCLRSLEFKEVILQQFKSLPPGTLRINGFRYTAALAELLKKWENEIEVDRIVELMKKNLDILAYSAKKYPIIKASLSVIRSTVQAVLEQVNSLP
jgi:hypothetical protein